MALIFSSNPEIICDGKLAELCGAIRTHNQTWKSNQERTILSGFGVGCLEIRQP